LCLAHGSRTMMESPPMGGVSDDIYVTSVSGRRYPQDRWG